MSRTSPNKKVPAKPNASDRAFRLVTLKNRAKRQGWLRWIRSEADEHAVLNGYYFDAARGQHAVDFGETYLCLTEGTWSGQPFRLQTWQYDQLFMPLFGWVHDSDEWGKTVRRFRRAYIQVPKKNGKSPIGAYIGIYMLAGDGEAAPKVFSAATDKEQASIVHEHAITMVEHSPALAEILKINRSTKRIIYPGQNGYYRVLSSAPKRNEGWNGNCCIADELHKWHSRALFDAVKWMFASRAEPLFFMITTAGNSHTSVCREQYEYACGVRDGRFFAPEFFPLIYEASPQDELSSEETWRKANPSLGHTIKLSDFRADYNEAKTNVGLMEAFKQLRLNVWTTAERAWLPIRDWDAGPQRRAEIVA